MSHQSSLKHTHLQIFPWLQDLNRGILQPKRFHVLRMDGGEKGGYNNLLNIYFVLSNIIDSLNILSYFIYVAYLKVLMEGKHT